MLPTSGKIFLLLLIAVTAYAFVQRARLLIRLLKLGKEEDRFDNPWARLRYAMGQVLLQRCVLKNVTRKDRSGLGHMLIFYGFCLFVISYGFHITEGFYDKLSPALFGEGFNNFFFFLLDAAGLIVLFALGWAAVRRYLIRPARLEPIMSKGAAIIIILIGTLMIIGFSVEGFRLLAEEKPFAEWTFVGTAFSRWFAHMGLAPYGETLFYIFWFVHIIIILGFGVYILYSKHLHILAAHFNLYFHSTAPKGTLRPITDMEEAEMFGAAEITDFSWKHLLDLYACTECGQCTANCPAAISEKPLTPKAFIVDLRNHLFTTGQELLEKQKTKAEEEEGICVITDVLPEGIVWDCTNCMACMEVCPVGVEHVPKIVDMRRYLVLMESEFPAVVQSAFRGMERNSNPWNLGRGLRGDWVKDLDVPILSEDGGEVEVLYYVGCSGSYDARNQKVAKSMVKILKAAGIHFGILGKEEGCCGDSARRIGNEYLYQMMVQENIETFSKYRFGKIVVTCPHGYNTLKKEYPEFGGMFEVVHHTELIHDLINRGKLRLRGDLDKTITYHDSCFLGRYNQIYEAPRDILRSMPKVKLVEMDRNRKFAFCCGAGGGRMWMERIRGQRVYAIRTEQALAKNPEHIATACPFCMTHFEDGLIFCDVVEKVKVLDIAEIVADQLAED
ncbi:MAG: (Fe-S)-binding protein [Deltaproteobacteria bacterium]|nr:(Fe-S)-binding protein [Deltaproteobacteria bacterium]